MKTHKTIYLSCLLAVTGGYMSTVAFAAPQPGIAVGIEAARMQLAGGGPVIFAYSDATVKPMPLPMSSTAPMTIAGNAAAPSPGPAGNSPGFVGSGVMSPVNLGGASASGFASAAAIGPQEFGTSNHPFTTSRVDLATTPANYLSSLYPYRATGKLYFKIGAASYVCSASLIKRGVIVTAAHCVTKFGGTLPRWYSSWQFVPARYDALAPYGVWNASAPRVMASYYNGTDTCFQAGVICQNDVAVLTITPQNNVYPGATVGWLAHGWNGYGFTPNNLALINQLGYPASHDAGLRMQRTDSQGFVSTMAGNTVWGSRQTGGSSGGPELVNLGANAVLSGGILLGQESLLNTVVGVTSWGYTNQAIKQQGASAFTTGNITVLVNAACNATVAACI